MYIFKIIINSLISLFNSQTFKNIYCMLQPGKTVLILSIAHHRMLFESLKVIMQDMRFASYMKVYYHIIIIIKDVV